MPKPPKPPKRKLTTRELRQKQRRARREHRQRRLDPFLNPRLPLRLSGTLLKYLAAALMLIDHIYQMFAWAGAPQVLTMLGRASAPIFIFMCAEGFYHTRSRRKYMLRLLAGFLAMNAVNILLRRFLPVEGVTLGNNIFGTMFLITLCLLFIERIREGLRERDGGRVAGGVALLFTPLLMMAVYESLIGNFSSPVTEILSFIPTLLQVEGSIYLVLLGILFYLLREYRVIQLAAYVGFSLLSLAEGGLQWMMVFAAIPLLCYSGERGRLLGPRVDKYFFYAFYPSHIYLLYLLAFLLQTK